WRANPARFRGPGSAGTGTVPFAAASRARSVPRGDSHGGRGPDLTFAGQAGAAHRSGGRGAPRVVCAVGVEPRRAPQWYGVAFAGPVGADQVEEISDDGQGSRARRRGDRRGPGGPEPGDTAGLAPVARGLALAGRPDTAALDFRERPGRGGAAATGGD